MKKHSVIIATLCMLTILACLCSCSSEPQELRDVSITSIDVYFDYDEKDSTNNTPTYRFNLYDSSNTSLKGVCKFSYYAEPSYQWTEDPDGTKHMHSTTGTGSMTVDYDESTFEKVVKLIKNGGPSFYTGPGSDSQGKLVYTKLPILIVLQGRDKGGGMKTIYIDGINNITKLLKTIEQLKPTDL